MVTWDTVRADHVGGDADHPSPTPFFDSLSRQGLRFTQARSPVPLTLPAHTSLLTGALPHQHGVRDNGGYDLSSEVPHLAQLLQAEGWQTAAFVSAAVLGTGSGIERGFEVYDDDTSEQAPGRQVPSRPGIETIRAATAWIEASRTDQPLFLWVHLFDPHRPWDAEAPWSEDFEPYRAEIAATDDQTRQLYEALEHRGPLDRTWLWIAGDHGEGLGEHGEWTHGYYAYESTLRVPLAAWWGESIGRDAIRGRTVDGRVSLTDLAPTLASLAGL
ncbi:MAG: sulfatase, partial [Myxococcota bacterium]|nr:sulfatase [Myxococcota bacterium]